MPVHNELSHFIPLSDTTLRPDLSRTFRSMHLSGITSEDEPGSAICFAGNLAAVLKSAPVYVELAKGFEPPTL
jgi:hypothetical protein